MKDARNSESLKTSELPPPMEGEDWSPFRAAALRLISAPYVAGLFFPAGSHRALDFVFPVSPLSEKVAMHMNRADFMPPCREVACRFPGLLSTFDAGHACQCPLKTVCGCARVDAIRLEFCGEMLGDIMLFAEGAGAITSQESAHVKAQAGVLAGLLWTILRGP